MLSDNEINKRIEANKNGTNSSNANSIDKAMNKVTNNIFCPECIKEDNENTNFCQNCGTKLTHIEEEQSYQNENIMIEKPKDIWIKIPVLDKGFNLKTKFMLDLIIAILIILDTFFLLLLDFSNVDSITAQNIINFDLTVCFILFCDFIFRLKKAKDKKAFFKDKNNWVAIIAMIPINFFVFRLFRYIKILPLLYKGFKHFNKFLIETHLDWSFGILMLGIFSGTIFFFIFEHGVNSHVNSLWDSFLFVMPTIITAGSNEIFPQTLAGEIIGVALMVTGVIAFGLFTASIAAMFVKSREKKHDNSEDLNELKLASKNLENEIKELKSLLKENK